MQLLHFADTVDSAVSFVVEQVLSFPKALSFRVTFFMGISKYFIS